MKVRRKVRGKFESSDTHHSIKPRRGKFGRGKFGDLKRGREKGPVKAGSSDTLKGVGCYIVAFIFVRRHVVLEEGCSWSVQYLVQALLIHSSGFEVMFGCSYAFAMHEDAVTKALALPSGVGFGGSSLWIRRTASGKTSTLAGRLREAMRKLLE